ncbi:phage antirepressor protein [Gammaproteobacteria bacterium ESL0073]|nr:phage antirepressor protein [Gammaproteobacteria bacterium ESL0073]
MNKLILNENVTMSSREIAFLTDKQHQHVKRDIEKMMLELKKDASIFGHIYTDTMNRKQTEYLLDKKHVECLLTGYSAELRMRVIERWHELESGVNRLPSNYIEALEFLVKSEKEKQVLSRELEIAKPAVDFVDNYVKAEGNYNFRQVAKLLNAKEPKLKLFLIENGIIYYTGRTMTPYQKHIDAGRFVVKTGVSDTEHAYTQMKFTPKGFNWISELWANRLREVA